MESEGSPSMSSRRQFIQAGLVTGAAVSIAPFSAAQEQSALPPSIAALISMKSQAKPITPEERRERIERARQLMAENKLDAVVITPGTSLLYFSNIRWWPSERFFAMVLPAKG